MTISYVIAHLPESWELQTWLMKLDHNETAAGGAQNPHWYVGFRQVSDCTSFTVQTVCSSDAASGWAGWALAHPEFGSSVNPITTRGGRLCPSHYC